MDYGEEITKDESKPPMYFCTYSRILAFNNQFDKAQELISTAISEESISNMRQISFY